MNSAAGGLVVKVSEPQALVCCADPGVPPYEVPPAAPEFPSSPKFAQVCPSSPKLPSPPKFAAAHFARANELVAIEGERAPSCALPY